MYFFRLKWKVMWATDLNWTSVAIIELTTLFHYTSKFYRTKYNNKKLKNSILFELLKWNKSFFFLIIIYRSDLSTNAWKLSCSTLFASIPRLLKFVICSGATPPWYRSGMTQSTWCQWGIWLTISCSVPTCTSRCLDIRMLPYNNKITVKCMHP